MTPFESPSASPGTELPESPSKRELPKDDFAPKIVRLLLEHHGRFGSDPEQSRLSGHSETLDFFSNACDSLSREQLAELIVSIAVDSDESTPSFLRVELLRTAQGEIQGNQTDTITIRGKAVADMLCKLPAQS